MDTYLKTVENIILHLYPMYGVTTLRYIHLQKLCIKKKKFCEILNRLHKAQCTEEENRVFKFQIVKDPPEYKYNTRHIFPFANAVKAHSNNIFCQIQEDKVTIQAEDVVCGNPKEGERDRAYYNMLIKDDYKINGLLQSLNAAVGAVCIVSCNLSTVDGLINGAVCTMKHIDYRNSKNANIPSTLWVQFEDEHIGQLHCQDYKHYYGSGISNTWTSIFTQYRETALCNCRAVRVRFPLIPAATVTIHKCQGSTLRNVVDMDVSPFPYYAENLKAAQYFNQHAHYVAASCVPSLSGLQIIDWSPEYIGVNKNVEEHMEHMNKHKLKLCYMPLHKMKGSYKCSFLNTRSLHCHMRCASKPYIKRQ